MFTKRTKINSAFGMMNTIIKTEYYYCFQNGCKSKNYFQILNKNLSEYENIELPANVLLDRVYHFDDIILARNGNTSKPVIIDLNDFSVTYLNNFPYFLGLNDEVDGLIVPIIDSIDIFSIPKSGLYDFFENKLLWLTSDANNLFFFNKVLLGELNNIIYRHNIIGGTQLWQFNINTIEENSKITRLIGTYQNILIAGISTDWLIGIDTETGKLVWKTKTSIAEHVIIDKEKGILRSIISKYYFEVDILTGKLNKIQYTENDSDFDSQRGNFVQIGNHIITSDWRKGKIGAFNTKTHKFDWLHEEPGISFPRGQTIKYFEPYLFVMDNKQALHIFEKV